MCFFWPGRYITVEISIRKSHFIKLCAHRVKHPFPLAEDHDLIALFFQKLPDEALDLIDLVPMICFERDTIYEAEHQAFFAVIAGKRSPESSADDALQSMIVLEAAIESWKTKKRIALEEIYT